MPSPHGPPDLNARLTGPSPDAGPGPEPGPALRLVVLRTPDLARARRFYEALGLRFAEERHGHGPRHLAATLPSGVVFELYPSDISDPATSPPAASSLRLGFTVPDLPATLAAAEAAGATILSAPPGTPHATVTDPDGHKVDLTTQPP